MVFERKYERTDYNNPIGPVADADSYINGDYYNNTNHPVILTGKELPNAEEN